MKGRSFIRSPIFDVRDSQEAEMKIKRFLAITLLLALFVTGFPHFRLSVLAQAPATSPSSFEDLDKAIYQARDQVKKTPGEASLYVELGRLLMKSGRQDEAGESLRTALELAPSSIEAHIQLARLYRVEYRFDEFKAALTKAESLDPKNEEARLQEAGYAVDRMDFAAAESAYQKISAGNAGSAPALYGLAEVAYWRNRFDDSTACIRRCLAVDPMFGKAYVLRSLIHRIRQENELWKEDGRKAVEVAPLDDEARANLSNILMRGEKKLEEGYAQAKLALRLNPLCPAAHGYIGNGWTAAKYGAEKIEGAPEVIGRAKDLLKQGSDFLISRDLDKVDSAYDEVLKLAPNNLRALIGKGTASYHRGRFLESLAWFRKALSVDPDYGLAHYGVAQSLLRLKDAINVKLAGIEKRFSAEDAPEPPYLKDVFINYSRLDPDLQKIIRKSVKPLRAFLKTAKDKGATFYITPFHFIQSEAPGMADIKGERTFDGRLWDDVKGLGGLHALSGEDWERDVRNLRYNVVSHEFTHQVHGLMPKPLVDEVKRLFQKAKERRLTLDFYADFNEFEYLATGVEAYVSEEKLPDQKVAYGHTRRELQARDPDLYRFIERFDKQDSLGDED
jgi:tetratricopeptide (TPR) repeat protein